MTELVELVATDTAFHSDNDEAAFFEWLRKIDCVRSVQGRGRAIVVSVARNAGEPDVRELLALFMRYRVDMRELTQLDCARDAWFRNPQAFWNTGG